MRPLRSIPRSTAAAALICTVFAAGPARSWEPGELLLGSPGTFQLSPTAVLQPEAALSLARGEGDEAADRGFSLQRAEAGLRASLGRLLGIDMALDFSGGEAALLDAFLEVRPPGDLLRLRAGWFRPPLGRQFGMPAHGLLLARDALAWRLLDLERRSGIELKTVPGGVAEITAGIWSAGDLLHADLPDPLVGARLALLPLGGGAMDVETRPGGAAAPFLSVGAAALFGPRSDRLVPLGGGELYDDHRVRAGIEVALATGAFTAAAEGFWTRTWTDPATPRRVADRLPPVDGAGAYLQAGWQPLPGALELAARFDWSDTDLLIASSRFHPAAGVTWFIAGHGLKLLAFYRFDFAIDDPFTPGTDYREPDRHLISLLLQAAI